MKANDRVAGAALAFIAFLHGLDPEQTLKKSQKPESVPDCYLWAAVRYVERNPVRAWMEYRAENYCWNSNEKINDVVEKMTLDPDHGLTKWLNVTQAWEARILLIET